jgi:hypothetical protein
MQRLIVGLTAITGERIGRIHEEPSDLAPPIAISSFARGTPSGEPRGVFQSETPRVERVGQPNPTARLNLR